MLKKAVDAHTASAAKKSLAQQLFSSSPPAAKGSQTQLKLSPNAPSRPQQPLSAASGNALKNGSGYHTSSGPRHSGHGSTQHAGLKRNSSGLTKALASQDAFDAVVYPQLGSHENDSPFDLNASAAKRSKIAPADDVFFDENDFDTDIDLDVEDPATKGTVNYPDLSSAPHSFINPTGARSGQDVQSAIPPTKILGAQSFGSVKVNSPPRGSAVPSSSALPWSSSPVEHFAKPSPINRFVYQAPAITQPTVTPPATVEGKPHGKRRTLPWLEQQDEEEESTIDIIAAAQKSKKAARAASISTPLPNKTKASTYHWNTTASALKEQQKKLRETHKKPVKVHEATEKSKAAAISMKKKKTVQRVFLSDEQQSVLNLVLEGKKSVFFTGSAGTGKSVLLREIIRSVRTKFSRETDRVAVTASTGLAACNIGGVTLHSFAGIGLGKEEVPELVKKIRRNQKAKHRWMRTKVLIIDEISMVDGDLFDKLEEIARILRSNGRPFGGIQLVITGDFFQLPPVPDGGRREAKFCFDAHSWNTTIEHTIGLHKVFRQKDPEFADMLNEMREGRLSPQSIAKFRGLSRDLRFEDQLEATELFPTRAEVDNANNARMRNLQGDVREYMAKDGGSIVDKALRDKLLQNCMAPERVVLKKGAQVMLIKNIDETLVNGSLGKVIGFMSEQTFDSYQQNEEEFYATQRSGADDDDGRGDPSGLPTLSERKTELIAGTAQLYPVVRFVISDGSSRTLLLQRESWKVELPSGEVQASRSQIPLILAWALSIHKAQGQTLERVKVDLGKVFEKGQAYVALSRATSIAGLQVLRFDPAKVVAHDRVRNFYAGLSRAEGSG